MSINEKEKSGLIELLKGTQDNDELLMRLAKHFTMNAFEIGSSEEAINYICVQCSEIRVVLGKRFITKDIIVKYLLQKNIQISLTATKVELIEQLLKHWNNAEENTSLENAGNNSGTVVHLSTVDVATEEEYPVNLLAREFSKWFFDKYNESSFNVQDFWTDVRLQLRMASSNLCDENIFDGTTAVVDALIKAKQNFDYYFNVNLTHNGVQGRMNAHGMVLVLACGTLHTRENCVGVFECTFGLLTDPFDDKRWKIKMVECIFKSQSILKLPTLYESSTYGNMLMIPVTPEKLD